MNQQGLCETASGGGGEGGGTGGMGGSPGGNCTTPENAAVYMEITYTDDDGITESGKDAASAIASDCVFGSNDSVPTNPGCEDQAVEVLGCALAGGCDAPTINALRVCVEMCTQALISEITDGGMLTDDCLACYGGSVSCGAAKCATSGCSAPTSPPCVECRCVEGCTPGFDVCSGFAPTGDCDPYL